MLDLVFTPPEKCLRCGKILKFELSENACFEFKTYEASCLEEYQYDTSTHEFLVQNVKSAHYIAVYDIEFDNIVLNMRTYLSKNNIVIARYYNNRTPHSIININGKVKFINKILSDQKALDYLDKYTKLLVLS